MPAQPQFSRDAFDLYGELKNRTILRPVAIPRLPDEVLSQALADTNQAIALIENALTNNHFQVVEDGDKFLRIIPDRLLNSPAGQYLSSISPVGAQSKQKSPPEEPLPKGGINFGSVDVTELLRIYAEYRQRNVLKSVTLAGIISLKNQTSLTHDETSYALNVALALNGLAAVDDGDKFVQVVPVFQLSQVKTNAPPPDKDGPLISPQEVPQFPSSFRSGPRLPGSPPQHSSNSTINDLVTYYATLTGSKYLPDENHGKWPVTFRITVPVTKSELLYGIETTLRLQGFTIDKADDETITLKPLQVGIRNPVK